MEREREDKVFEIQMSV